MEMENKIVSFVPAQDMPRALCEREKSPAIHMNNRWYYYQLISNSIPIIYIIRIIVDT